MLFSSITFLYFFLPAVLAVYFFVPARLKNPVLLASSLVFYAFGEPVYVLLLVISSLSDWLHSLYIEAHRGSRGGKIALCSSIVVNLGMLGFFKYADFLLSAVNALLGTHIPLTEVPLPIGISFFTFQTMSYTIDVYRGRVHAQRNLATLATFVCLFPQLIAGPIVRYADVERELVSRHSGDGFSQGVRRFVCGLGKGEERQTVSRHSGDGFSQGVRRFVCGLGKKVLIANGVGELCAIFRASTQLSVLYYWVYAVAFTLQIYFDFSGYSDMAIGLGRMFGFTFPENFDYPYVSRSITEFWRRWHQTLGGWFRDYVYIPLGGNRTSRGKWLRNLAVVWLLTGLWHGAAWNFVLWGGLFGLLLMMEKLWLGKYLARAGRVLPHVYVLLVVVISFVIFNGDGISGALSDLGGLVGWGGLPLVSVEAVYYLRSYGVLLALAVVGSLPLCRRLWARVQAAPAMTVLEPLGVGLLLLACTAALVDASYNPFLYFRF